VLVRVDGLRLQETGDLAALPCQLTQPDSLVLESFSDAEMADKRLVWQWLRKRNF